MSGPEDSGHSRVDPTDAVVTATQPDPAPRAARRWLRWVGAAVVAALTLAAVALIGGFFGLASGVLGWLWAALALFVGGALAALILRPRRLGVVLAIVGVVALVLGTYDWYVSPPSLDRIHRVSDAFEAPSGWVEVDTEGRGNTWCFKGCPVVEVTYTVPADADAAMQFRDAMTEAGWSEETPWVAEWVLFGDWGWHAELAPTGVNPDQVYVRWFRNR